MGVSGYRAVGIALHKNPFAPQVHCYHMVAFGGLLGGLVFWCVEKVSLLEKECVCVRDGKINGVYEKLFRFESFKKK